eukprot:3545264-Rhodomonas_salina.1
MQTTTREPTTLFLPFFGGMRVPLLLANPHDGDGHHGALALFRLLTDDMPRQAPCQCGKSRGMNVMSPESRFVSPAQACQVLGVCHETLRRWSKEGKIRHVSGGPNTTRRYDLSSVIKSTPAEPEEASNTGRVDVIYAR